ncbi:autotransporter assembly complex family protein, partial [Rugamonas sp.]|uniref:autotransporter assembly complex protein TamA n=1 Tax=Rugamonas sp. TaxID=1926287 RepID=UPI0025FED506
MACLTLAGAMTPVAALAAPAPALNYTVSIDAPGALDKLLEHNLDLLRYRGNPRIDREQLQRMVRAAPEQIKTLVATDGYYSPVVSVSYDRNAAAPTVRVTVQPGQPTVVADVELELQGFDAPPGQPAAQQFDTAALKNSWSLKTGAVFRQSDWEAAKRDFLRQVVQTRYPRAQMTDSTASVDPDAHQARLHVTLASGPEMRFGQLRIEGLKRYPATLVSNLNQIKPGDYYSEAALQAYQARLQDTGYFSGVEVSADTSSVLSEQLGAAAEKNAPGSTDEKTAMAPLPLLVRVTENKRKNVSVGLGYSTNTGNRTSLAYDDLSVFGLRMKSALTVETRQQTASVNFFFPVTPQGYTDSVGASFVRTDLSGDVTGTSTVSAKRAWGTPLLERSVTLEFLSEDDTVGGLPTEHAKAVPLTYAVTFRRLDNLVFPTKGYVLNAQIGAAPLPVLTDEVFGRGYTRAILYRPIGPRGIAIFRGEAGALLSKSKDGVPQVYQFRAGGDQSVRGYAFQELGVREGAAITGGRYLATASAEFQYWFKPTYGAAVFYDAGNAGDTFNALHPKSGYGVGGRWKSPVGPINVDVAYGHA